RRRHTRSLCDWSSDVCSSDLGINVNYTILPSLRFESLLGVKSINAVGEAYATEYSHYIAGIRHYDYGAFGVGEVEYEKSQLPHGGEFNSIESRITSLDVRNSLA